VARKSSSTAIQEELYPLPNEAPDRDAFDDSRLVDLEAEQESPFLRGQKRVSVRRGTLPKKTANRLKWVALALLVLVILGAAAFALYDYGEHSWRFRIDSSDQIEVEGATHVPHAQIMDVMGADIGRNIFFVPLALRKQQLEQIPWVESASVMRFVPNRLRIEIHERTPVAFARIGSHISLIDAGGTLMELAPGGKHKYSFPVIAGMNAGEPLSTRAARMKNYNALVRDLDASGARYSQELSEVDISDPEDVKVIAADSKGDVLVHLGSGSYLQRYKTYVTHVQQWRQQFDKLESVDLRYDGQIIVNPDLDGVPRQPALTPAAAKAAVAAGVKTAAIVNYEKYVTRPGAPVPAKGKPKTPVKTTVTHVPGKPLPAKTASARKPAAKPAPPKRTAANSEQPAKLPAAKSPQSSVQPISEKQSPPKPASPKPAMPKSVAANQPNRIATPVIVSTGSKKPSAGISKETPQN
jgi:cell division protein FtsQ